MSEPTPIHRRRYTKKQKAVVVGIAVASGQTAAAEATGVPLTTLNRWFHQPEFVEMRTTAREDVASQMWIGVQVGVQEMVNALKSPDVSLREKTDATSMLSEKYLLLTGQATSRTETRELTDTLDDHERETLRDAIDAYLRQPEPA